VEGWSEDDGVRQRGARAACRDAEERAEEAAENRVLKSRPIFFCSAFFSTEDVTISSLRERAFDRLAGAAMEGIQQAWGSVLGPHYRRDAVGRVVVEDGLARMETYSEGMHSEALRGTSKALASAHAKLSELMSQGGGALGSSAGQVSTVLGSVMGPNYRRDAIGRVVVEDGLVRMQPYGSGLHTEALRATTEALALSHARLSGLLSQGGDTLGHVGSSAGQFATAIGSAMGPQYRRDAIGRVVVEDGLARMQPYGSGMHTEALKSASEALATAHAQLSSLLAHGSGALGSAAGQAGNVLGTVMAPQYRRDAIGRVVVEDGLIRMQVYGGRGLHVETLQAATDAVAYAQQLVTGVKYG
jgi:hypothetical protein